MECYLHFLLGVIYRYLLHLNHLREQKHILWHLHHLKYLHHLLWKLLLKKLNFNLYLINHYHHLDQKLMVHLLLQL